MKNLTIDDIKTGIAQTKRVLAREYRYAENLRNVEFIERYEKHLVNLYGMISMKFALYVNNHAVRNGQDEWTVGCGNAQKRFTTEELYDKFKSENQLS